VAPVPAPQLRRLSTAATSFLNACVGSRPFGRYLAEMPGGNSSLQGTLCSCLTGGLVGKVADSDLPVLAQDFAETRSSSTPPANYPGIAAAAQDGLRGCMREAGIQPPF
jgi:hypothetical protein